MPFGQVYSYYINPTLYRSLQLFSSYYETSMYISIGEPSLVIKLRAPDLLRLTFDLQTVNVIEVVYTLTLKTLLERLLSLGEGFPKIKASSYFLE